ncbi:MAG: heme-binding protein [Chloroflexi bacterium]|nr:heme-binding protein [Chloroflexota bacterium]
MHSRETVGLSEGRRALDAIAGAHDATGDPRPIAVAVVDDAGELVAFARSGPGNPLSGRVAMAKAYSAARTRTETAVLGARLAGMGVSVGDLADPGLTTLQGGVPVLDASGACVGAIGVSGLAAGEDEALARRGVEAIASS